jgi:hypothetical protein
VPPINAKITGLGLARNTGSVVATISAASCTGGGGETTEGETGVIDNNGGNASRHLALIRHEQGNCAGGDRLIEKVMRVETFAAQGDE